MHGVVVAFDEHRGYGTIRTDGGVELFFHCTRLADGTRAVDVGAEVDFEVAPGHHGRYEAAAITKR